MGMLVNIMYMLYLKYMLRRGMNMQFMCIVHEHTLGVIGDIACSEPLQGQGSSDRLVITGYYTYQPATPVWCVSMLTHHA